MTRWTTNDALVPGQVITLKARRKPELPALAARVMWSNDHQAGLRILRERPEGAAAWRFAFANQAA